MENSKHKEYALLQAAGSSDNDIYSNVITVLKKLNSHETKTLLDIGCGKGAFLNLVKDNFSQFLLSGTDLFDYQESISKIGKWLKLDLNDFATDDFEKYDIITAIEVIEHLENPRHFIRSLSKLLKPNGHLIITTPNTESFTSLLSFALRGYHSAFGPRSYPAHITSVSSFELKLMAKEIESLDLIDQIYIPNGRIPGTKLRWKSIFPFLTGKRYSDNYISIIKKI